MVEWHVDIAVKEKRKLPNDQFIMQKEQHKKRGLEIYQDGRMIEQKYLRLLSK